MTADLLRQLDSYGEQLDADLDHVTADEVLERLVEPTTAAATGPHIPFWSRPWLKPVLGLGVILVIIGLGVMSNVTDDGDAGVAALVSGDATATTTAPPTTLGGRGDSFGGAAFSADPTGVPSIQTTLAPFPTTTMAAATTTRAPAQAATTTRAPAQTTTTGVPTTTPPSLTGRDIVFTAQMVVAVTDSAASADDVARIAESFGGFVSNSETSQRAGQDSVLTLRVPPGSFRQVLDRIGGLGVVRSERVTSDDVTEVVVDLESQIVTTEVSVERLRALLAEASQLQTITRLESELLAREKELERLRGQLRTVESQVALATVTVTLTESIGNPLLEVDVSRYSGADGGFECPEGDGPRIRVGDDLTVCVLVRNSGDVPLTDVTITGDIRALLTTDLTTLRGTLGRLDPGDSVLLTGQTIAERRTRTGVTVEATPLNDLGEAVPARAVSETRNFGWDPAAQPEPDPPEEPDTITRALEDGWSVFATAVGWTARAIAFLLPFLGVFAVIAGAAYWRQRRYWSAAERAAAGSESHDQDGAPSA